MKYFSMPADFKKETIDKYAELNRSYKDSKVVETYGNITIGNFIESGRQVNVLPGLNFSDFQSYLEYSIRRNINFNYTINASYMRNREFLEEGILEIHTFLAGLYEAGVRDLTITLPPIIELVKMSGFKFNIKASTICQITNPYKARAYKNMGVERIVVDESVHRDFETLKKICRVFGNSVEIIVNTLCHKNCIYRMFHYNQMAGDSFEIMSKVSAEFYPHRCMMHRLENIGNLLKLCWVRPEDLKYYTNIGIYNFKLQGRQNVLKGDPVKAVEYYFKESFDGNLMDLLYMFSPGSPFQVFVDNKKLNGFLKPFYEKGNFCKNDCANCNYCEKFIKNVVDYKDVEEVYKLGKGFYSESDKYKVMLNSIKKSMKINKINQPVLQDDGDFAF